MKPVFLRLPLLAVVTLLALALPWAAGAYYHFVHYQGSRSATPTVVEKFDLGDLVDNTVFFHVASRRPALSVNDSYEGLISQIRLALSVWNGVSTSSLRVGFGGVADGPIRSQSPAGEIIFAELPPGVIAMGGPVTRGAIRGGFVPIVRSQVILSNDLANGANQRPSFSEEFFTSLVHEVGHALGLQHTMTGAVMSTAPTRATTRAQPLAPDDVAGISVLYPSPSFSKNFGSLSGRVATSAGVPAALASVVAITPFGGAISALADPDGAYRIEGLLPGRYLVYAHPLPPASQDGLGPANIVLPTSTNLTPIAPGPLFKTVFYGGAQNPDLSPAVDVVAGGDHGGIDFKVEPTREIPFHSITTYSFPGNRVAGRHPAFLNLTEEPGFLLAYIDGDYAANAATSTLASVSVRSLDPELRVRRAGAYEPDRRFARLDFDAAPFAGFGPRHLIFNTGRDIYVLPAALHLAPRAAPIIHWMIPSFSTTAPRAWTLWASNLDPRAQVFCDGVAAELVGFDAEMGEIEFLPPPAPAGHRSIVTVLNPDGQSSAFTLPDGNIVYDYPDGPPPSIVVRNASAPPDQDLVVEISGQGIWFDENDIALGFGTSDIVPRKIEVVRPNRMRAVVSVLAGAAPGAYAVTIASGLQLVTAPNSFRVDPTALPARFAPWLRFGSLVNAASLAPDLSPGVVASLFGARLTSPRSDAVDSPVRVVFNGQDARLLSVSDQQINLVVPADLAVGPVEMFVHNGEAASEPLLVELELVSPGVFTVLTESGESTAAGARLAPGERATVVATGLAAVAERAAERPGGAVLVLIGGMRVPAESVREAPGLPAVQLVTFVVPRLPIDILSVADSTLELLASGKRSNTVTVQVALEAVIGPIRTNP